MTVAGGGIAPQQAVRLSVGFLPLPNFTFVAFAGFVDTLRLAADEGDRSRPHACRWTVLAPSLRPIRSSCGVEVMPTETLTGRANGLASPTLAGPDRLDYLVVAGGLLPGPERGMLDPAIQDYLREAVRQGVTVIGICTGSFALAEAGLLRPGSRCCVSWYHYQDLLERFPLLHPVADRLWVRDGQIITCAGGLAAVDLAATLVQTHIGAASAQKSLHIMLTDRLRPAASAQPQPPNMVAVSDGRVRRAMLLMEQNLATPLRAEQLAAAVGVSKRQLERLFAQSLGAGIQIFARDLRLAYAVWQMAHDKGRIADVAAQCGFADAAHFSRVFRTAFGRPPSQALRDGAAALQAMLDGWWPYGEAIHPEQAAETVPGPSPHGPSPHSADRRPYL